MRNPAFYILENKGCTADQCLCLSLTDSTVPLLLKPKFQAFSLFLWLYRPVCVRNPEDRFFRCGLLVLTRPNVGKKVTGKKVTEKKSQIWVGKKVTGKKVTKKN